MSNELPKLPEPALIGSNVDWKGEEFSTDYFSAAQVLTIQRAAFEAGAAHGASQMKERCETACNGKRLVDPCKGVEEAYEIGIDSCLDAIRSLGSE